MGLRASIVSSLRKLLTLKDANGVLFVAPKNMSEKNSQIEEKKMNKAKSGVCRICKVIVLGCSKGIFNPKHARKVDFWHENIGFLDTLFEP